MELEKCHLLFGCEIMKFFSTGLLLLIVFGSLEGSTIPHKRTVRALNATIQTHFNGTIQRRNPCNNSEVERSSYRGCHEFHHHSKESNWSDYTRKCATLISDFFHAISNLVTFKDRQSGTFDLNINTKVSHKTDGVCVDTKKPVCPTPTVILESTDCEVLPSTGCDDLPRKDTHSKGSEICSLEEAVESDEDEDEDEKCSVGSEISVNQEPQTAGTSSLSENGECFAMSYSGEKISEHSDKTTPELKPAQKVSSPEIKLQSEVFQPETIPTYDNYPSSDQTSETTNTESSVSNTHDDKSVSITVKPDSTVPSSEAPSTVTTNAPKVELYIDVSKTPQQSTGTDSAGQETPSDSKDYLSDYATQTNEEKTEIQPSSATQSENDKVVPEYDGPSIEFSDKIALYNVHEPQHKTSQTFSPSTQHYSSDTTTPSTFEIKSDYDAQDVTVNIQPTSPPQYQSESYDEQIQSSQAVAFTTLQPQQEDYVNQYDQVPSDLPTSSPPKDEASLQFSDQLAVYNVRQPQPESPSSSSLLNEPTSIQTPSSPESQPENYVNYEDGLPSNQLPTSTSPPKGEEPSLEFSDQLAVYNVRQPYFESTSTQPASSEPQPDNYDSYEDETEKNESVTSSSSTANVEPSIEFSDQLAVYNIRTPTTTYPPSSVQPSVSSETQPTSYVNYEDEAQSPTFSPPEEEEPSIEFSDQLAVYNVREPLPGSSTPYPLVSSSIQPSAPQSEDYMNYENEESSNETPTPSSPQHGEEQYLEYSDQLAVYNIREPLPGTTTSSPLVSSTIQPSASQSDSYVNYENNVSNQAPASSSSSQRGEEQYVEYSDQLAVYNVREPLPGTTTPSSVVNENIQSSFATTLPPLFSSYELDTYDDQKTGVEPQPTSAPKFEEVYSFQPVTSQSLPSNEPTPEYDGEYNEQTVSNQMTPFTTPAGNVYPTTIPSTEYIDNNGPGAPSSDYSSSQDFGGFVSTSLPSSSDDVSSFNNFELQYDSLPASTQHPSEAQQYQVFSDQVSDIREPQSDSSVSDGRISDMVTTISPIAESESSNSYDDESSLNDSQQTVPSESQSEASVTDEYTVSFSPNQPLSNSYNNYDEQSSTSETEAPMTSANEPTTHPQFPFDMTTTSPSSNEPEKFGIYDDSQFSVEPQGTYPPIIENESFANYEDNVTSTAGQASVSIVPLSDNDSPQKEPTSSEEGSSSEEEEDDGHVADSDDQGLLPLSPNTFRPTVQIETTVNYADQTPFRPIRLPSSIGPLQENNIIYDEGILGNETEPSTLGGEEANNSLNVSSELTKQNEGKELDSSTTLAPELEFDTYYEETFKQPSSSDAPKTNNYMTYEDDVQPSSPKFDLNTTVSNDYSTSFFPSTPSFSQEIITTPSTSEAMPETYTDYEYSKTDLNSQTTFPPQTESVLYDDHSSQDQSLTQQQSVDYAADSQIQSTTSPNPSDPEMIDFSDEVSIYNVPETVLKSSSPSLSELFSSDLVPTTQPTTPSDGQNSDFVFQSTLSPSVEPQSYDEQSLPSKDQNLDTYVNYEDTMSSSQLPTTTLPPNEVEPSLEYSDQLAIYNVRQPQPESPSSSSLLNEPTSIQPPSLPESQPENYVNYEDVVVSNQLPTSTYPPKGEEPSLEFSDQLAVYNVRQPYFEPTSTQPASSGPQSDNYDSYEDETESNETTTSSSPTVDVEPSIKYSDEVAIYNVQSPLQFSSPSPQMDENIPQITISTLPPSSVNDESVSPQTTSPQVELESGEDYEDETVSNDSPATLSSPKEEPSIEFADQLAVYNVRQPSTVSPLSSVSYLEPNSAQPSLAPESQPDNYVSYEDERVSSQTPTTSSPNHEEEQYLEYSDQLAVYNVREPLPGTTTSSPLVPSSIQPSTSDSNENYEDEVVSQQPPTSPSPQHGEEQYLEYSDQLAVYNVREPLPGTTTSSPLVPSSIQPSSSQLSEYMNYENEEIANQTTTPTSPQHGEEQYLEYSDQLAVYNIREPLPSTTTSSPAVIEDIPSSYGTTLPPLFSSNRIETYDDPTVGNELQPTDDPEMYDEPTPAPATSLSPTETQPENYVNYENGELPTSSPQPKSVEPFLEYSDQLAIYNVRQPEYYSSSPSPVNENLATSPAPVEYMDSQPTFAPESEDQTVSDALTTSSPVKEVEPSLEYSDQLAIYNVREPVFTSTAAPVASENVPSSITTLSPSSLSNEPISPQPSSSESQSDSYEDYEDVTVSNETSTTLSLPAQPQPSVEYSDQLAAFNVLGPVIVPISAPVVDENVPSGGVTTSLPSALNDGPTSSQSSSESDSDGDYEDETVSTPSPLLGDEPALEVSDELSIYNVRQRPSELSSPSSLSENIPSVTVTTFAPSLPSEFESYDYQSVGFESQPTFSPEGESQTYSTLTSIPSTTLRPSVDVEPSLEYSDELAVYNVRSPFSPSSTPSPLLNENNAADTVSTFMPAPVYDESTFAPSTSPEQQSDNYINYEDQLGSETFPVTYSPSKEEPSMTPSDQFSINTTSSQSRPSEGYDYDNQVEYTDSQTIVPTQLTPQTSNEPTSVGPLTSSEPQPEQYVNYEDERISTPLPTSTSSPTQVEPSVEYSDQLAVYNVREPIFEPTSPPVVNQGTTLSPSSPLNVEPISVRPSSSESQSDSDEYEDENVSNESLTTLSTPVQMQVEPSVEYSDELAVYNVREPLLSSTPAPAVSENVANSLVTTLSPSSNSQSDSYIYEDYKDETVSKVPSTTLPTPVQVEPSVEYSDQLAIYNVRQPEYSSSSPSPLNEMVTTAAPSLPSDGFGMYDTQVIYTDFQPTSSPQSDSQMYDEPKFVPASSQSQSDNYVNYEDKVESNQVSSSLSPPAQVEPSVEYSDELAVYNVREPLPSTTTSSPVVSQNIPNSAPSTTLSPSSPLSLEPISVRPSSSESQSDSDEYEDENETNESLSTLSTPLQLQVEPSVEYSDQLAVYNVREPLLSSTSPPAVSENVSSSVVTTLPPSSSLILEQTSPQSSSSHTQSHSGEDYEDETVSTPSPVSSYEPTLEVSDELSIYNVRQRPSEMTTPSPFNNDVISNLMTTISPYFTFKESSSKNNLNGISQTTVIPEYDSDMYDEGSSIQPSQSSEDDSPALSDETTSKDFLPETLSNSDEQTISNVIQSTQSPDLSNQLYSKNEVEFQEVSYTTVQPNVESSVISESSADQEFDYRPTLSPDYETHVETMTTSPSSSQSQDNYVVYEDQMVSHELTTSSPVNEVEPSLEYDNALLPETSVSSTSTPPFLHDNHTTPPSSEVITETYTDYEESTANSNSLSTLHDEATNPGQAQTSTSQPQIVNYDYYNDQTQNPEESSTSPPTTEIETKITLTEFGPTLPPNFESQIFDESSSIQPNNYDDYEDSAVSNQTPTSPSPQTNSQPSIEFSDELAVYNVRKPYLEPTSIQPSSSESQTDNYDTYEDQVIVNELSTPSIPQKVEYTVTQPTTTPEEETQQYDEPTSSPTASTEPQPDNYVNYENDMISNEPMSSTVSTNQVEPSIEYSDELAVYNVREPLPSTTTSSPVANQNIPSSVVTTPSPSPLNVEPISIKPSSNLQSDSYSYEDYKDETVSKGPSTTLPTPVQVEPSVEYSDQLAVYNVREPIFESTSPPTVAPIEPPSSPLSMEPISAQPSSESQSDSDEYEDENETNESLSTLSTPLQVQAEPSVEYSDQLAVYNVREPLLSSTSTPPVSENVSSSVVTTLPPSSSLILEQTSPQSSSSHTQSDSGEDYEDETVSTPSPVSSYEPTLEVSDELSIYNVRQRPSEMTTPSPFNNDVISNLMTTIAPYFTSSSSDYEGTSLQSPVTSEPEPELDDQPYSASSPSSQSTSDNYVNSEDGVISDEYSTSSPPTEAEQSSTSATPFEYPEQLPVYNVRQRPSELSSSSLLIENFSDDVVTTSAPSFSSNDYASYDIQNEEPKFSSEGKPKSNDNPNSTQNPSSVSQPENYVSYEDEIVSNDLTTSSPATTDGQPSIEFTDQLAVYNVRQPSTVSPLSSVSYLEPNSAQPSLAPESQSDNYVSYEDERVSSQTPTTSSPNHEEEQYLEYSDQLAVYNVREPLPGTTTSSPLVPSSVQPSTSDSDENYEDEVVSQRPSTSPSPQHGEEQYLEYSDQLAVYNVREPLPTTTTSSPVENEDISSSVVTTTLPFSKSETKTTQASFDSQSDSYQDYESEFPTTVPPSQDIKTSFSNSIVTTAAPSLPSEGYEYDNQVEYTDSQTTVPTQLTPQTSNEPTSVGPLTSSEPQPEQYVNYEDERISTPLPTSTSSPMQVEPSEEYSDQLAVYNVREPIFEPTSPPVINQIIPSSVVTTLSTSPLNVKPISIQPSSSESQSDSDEYEDENETNESLSTLSTPVQMQVEPSVEYSDQLAVYNVREPLLSSTSPPVVSSIEPSSPPLNVEPISTQSSSSESQKDSDEDYEEETGSNESPTTVSTPVQMQVEPSVEYSDELAVYNVREPLLSSTPTPAVGENVANSLVTTLSPSSNSQSDSYVYEDYKDETVPKGPSTTLPTPVQVEPSVEYSDQLAVYNVRQPQYLTSPSPLSENFANDLLTTVAPSLGPGGFETYDNQVVYTDFQPTSSPQSDSQIYDEPTSIPASSSESQTDYDVNYDDKMASNVAATSASPPVDVDIEYSDELAIYNVRQTSTASPSLSDIVTTPPSSVPNTSDSDKSYIFTDQLSIVRAPESDSHVKASNVFTTLSPFTQSSVESEQDDFYTYDDRTQPSDTQTTFSPETEIEYDEAPTSFEPQSSSSTQSFLETMVTTFQPRTEPPTNKTENKTSIPSKQQEVSTFPPLHPFIPLIQPSYPPPGESKLVSEQQDQVISNQVVNSPLVPSSELDSEKQSNNFSNLVKPQETHLIDGVESTRRDSPQPEPFALVPDQTNPSNEPGEDYVSCTCTRGNGKATQHTLMCPFNPVLKGNMTAPSYYILISKLSGGSDNQSQTDEERFQVEKVYLGDGTPLNCTDERKAFPTSKYTPVPISSARTVKLPIRLNNA